MTPLDHFRRMPQDQRMQAYRIVDYDTKEWTWYEPRAAQLVLREAMRKHNRILVPKARRLGASTEVEAYLFDALLMADRPLPIATMAHVDRAAKNIAGMLRGMYDGLPAGLRPKASKLNDSQIVLEESGANQTVYMAGAHGGTRSFAAAMGHLSEFDFYKDQKETLAEVDATVGSGLLVLESTVNQPGSTFQELVDGAPDNGWHVCFLSWALHPAYADRVNRDFMATATERELMEVHGLTLPQVAWRRRKIATLGIHKFTREYPLTVDECFRTQAKRFFTADIMDDVEILKIPPTDKGRLYVVEPYNESLTYTMGVDVAAGVGADDSAITIMDAGTREPVLHWHCNRTTPEALVGFILRHGGAYGWPMANVEHNVYGRHVVSQMIKLGYPRRRMWTDDKGRPWRTHGGNRPALFEIVRTTLEQGLMTRLVVILNGQIEGVGWNEKKNRPDHATGKHDDILISTALALLAASTTPLRLVDREGNLSMDDLLRRQRAKDAQRAHPFRVRGEKRRPM